MAKGRARQAGALSGWVGEQGCAKGDKGGPAGAMQWKVGRRQGEVGV